MKGVWYKVCAGWYQLFEGDEANEPWLGTEDAVAAVMKHCNVWAIFIDDADDNRKGGWGTRPTMRKAMAAAEDELERRANEDR